MTGLKKYVRDPELPAQVGDDALCVPSEREVRGLINDHLRSSSGPEVAAVSLDYARWKPGRSITCTFGVDLADGQHEIVVLKKYLDGKAGHVARHFQPGSHLTALESSLLPFAVLEDLGLCLFRFPADRVLRGAARVLNTRRLARRIDESGCFAPFVVRLRPSTATLLRFKPERRAVFRFTAKLRGPDDERDMQTLGVRVLPPDLAQVVAARRSALAPPAGLCPALIDFDAESGVLIEEWLPGAVNADDDFDTAHDAGASLAAFHLGAEFPGEPRTEKNLDGLAALFRVDTLLMSLWERVRLSSPESATHWIHGDFHPDQLIHTPGCLPALLDLDAIEPGHPAEDLGSWIADHLTADPNVSFAAAADPLLQGYGSKLPPPAIRAIYDTTRRQLVARAGAGIRRLEEGAISKARRLLEAALNLQSSAGDGA